MRIAFFSDTHLGHRRFGRIDENGLNVREVDVMQTFRRFLNSIEEREPDVVLHGGDFFDVVRPSNLTLSHALQSVLKFQERRGGRPFIVVAGNHEVPKVKGTGCALQLYNGVVPGFKAVISEPESIAIGEGHVLHCVPTSCVGDWAELREKEDGTILLMHGLVDGIEHGRPDLSPSKIQAQYSFAFLGDYHIHKSVTKTVVYVGSTDYVATNFWKEIETPKGWLELDTDSWKWTFHRVEPVRKALSLPTIDASELTTEEIGERMREQLVAAISALADDKPPIVRQEIINAAPDLRREIPFALLQECRSRCLDYDLVARAADVSDKGDEMPQVPRGKTLVMRWEEFAKEYEIPDGVDRSELIDTGKEYLLEARNASAED